MTEYEYPPVPEAWTWDVMLVHTQIMMVVKLGGVCLEGWEIGFFSSHSNQRNPHLDLSASGMEAPKPGSLIAVE